MKCLINGKLIIGEQIVDDKAIIFEDKIVDIVNISDINKFNDLDIIDVKGQYISPGLIDIHIHGYMGEDASDGSVDGIKTIAKELPKNGVTSFLPTTMTVANSAIVDAIESIKKAKSEDDGETAQILGIHLEGPFINEKFKGAQNAKYIMKPDADFVLRYKDIIKIVTVAPEVDGAIDFVDRIKKESDIVLSMGHTNSTYEQAMLGFEHGISDVTHTFNAMTGIHHRKPGALGAALTTDNVTCEFIADTIHVNKALFPFILKLKGLDKLVLITDCIRAGGLPEGEYTLGNQKVYVKDGKPILEDGTIAGSVLKLNNAVKNFNQNTNLNIAQAVKLASYNPAKIIGVDDRKGSLDKGKDADIIVFNQDFDVNITIRGGKVIYEKI